MDVLSNREIDAILDQSKIMQKYNEEIDRESAYEILTGKIEDAQSIEAQEQLEEQNEKARKTSRRGEKSTFEKVVNSTTTRQIGRTVAREITRGILGVLGIKTTRRRSTKRTGWF